MSNIVISDFVLTSLYAIWIPSKKEVLKKIPDSILIQDLLPAFLKIAQVKSTQIQFSKMLADIYSETADEKFLKLYQFSKLAYDLD